MYEIKQIEDKDYYKLLELHYEFQLLFPLGHTRIQASSIMLEEISREDSLGVGLYKDGDLVGFINGYKVTDAVFHIANIYVREGHRLKVLALMKYTEDIIKSWGYKIWKTISYLPEGARIVKKFGGKKWVQ